MGESGHPSTHPTLLCSPLLCSTSLYSSILYFTFTISASFLFPVQLYSTLLSSNLFYFILFCSGLHSHFYPTAITFLSVHVYPWFLPLHRPKPLLRNFSKSGGRRIAKPCLLGRNLSTKAWKSRKPKLLLRDFHSERIWKTEKAKPVCKTSVKHVNGGAEQRSYSEQSLWFRGMEVLGKPIF